MKYSGLLEQNKGLATRLSRSEAKLEQIREMFAREELFKNEHLTIFCAGSLARRELGDKSDLDLFVLSDTAPIRRSKLQEYTLFGRLIAINADLGFEEFSNDGRYLKIYDLNEIKKHTGTPSDDSENLFTARMLLLLESAPISNMSLYDQCSSEIIEHYFRDSKGKKTFKPLFLLNDILRYWRTLCLNYEERRADTTKPWRKKNINLKFARLLTVFGTVLPLIAHPITNATDLTELCKKRPLDRLSDGLTQLNDPELEAEFIEFLEIYEKFLTWKEASNPEAFLDGGEKKQEVTDNALKFSTFIYKALMHQSINVEYRKYLVI